MFDKATHIINDDNKKEVKEVLVDDSDRVATIYDLAKCMGSKNNTLHNLENDIIFHDGTSLRKDPKKFNEKLLNWKDKNRITRADEFLKNYPNAHKNEKGVLNICPSDISKFSYCIYPQCDKCKEVYWLEEMGGDL